MLRGIPTMDHMLTMKHMEWSATPSPSPPLTEVVIDQWVPPSNIITRSGSPVLHLGGAYDTQRYHHHGNNNNSGNNSGPPSPLLSPMGTPPLSATSSSSSSYGSNHNNESASPLSSAAASPVSYSPSSSSLRFCPLTASPRIRSRLVDLDSEDDGNRGRVLDELNENQKRRERRRSQTNLPVITNTGHSNDHTSTTGTAAPTAGASSITSRYGICCNDINHRHLTVSSADLTTASPAYNHYAASTTNSSSQSSSLPSTASTLSICTSSLAAAMAASSQTSSLSSGSSSPFAFPPHTIPASYSAFSASPPLQSSTLRHPVTMADKTDNNNNSVPSVSTALSSSSSPSQSNVSSSVMATSLSINYNLPYEDINDGGNGYYSPTLSHIGVTTASASPVVSLRTRVSSPNVVPSSLLVPLTGNNNATSSTNGNTNNTNNNGGMVGPGTPPTSGKSKRDKSQDPDNPTPIFHLPTALLNEGGMGGRARRGAAAAAASGASTVVAGGAANNNNNANTSSNGTHSNNGSCSPSPSSSPCASPVMTSSTGSLHSLRARSITSFTLPPSASSAVTSGSPSRHMMVRPDSPPPPHVDSMTMLRLADDQAYSRPAVAPAVRSHRQRGLATITEKRSLTAPMPIRRLSPSRGDATMVHHSYHQSIDSSDAEYISQPVSPDPSTIMMLSPNASFSSPMYTSHDGTNHIATNNGASRRTFASALAAANAARRYQSSSSVSSALPPAVPVNTNNGSPYNNTNGGRPSHQRRQSPPNNNNIMMTSMTDSSSRGMMDQSSYGGAHTGNHHMLSPTGSVHLGYPSPSSSSSSPSHHHHQRSPSASSSSSGATMSPQRRSSPPSHHQGMPLSYGKIPSGLGYVSKNTQFVTAHSTSSSSNSAASSYHSSNSNNSYGAMPSSGYTHSNNTRRY